jgi:serine phosphatase RsbU (regulator of sigma subunit)
LEARAIQRATLPSESLKTAIAEIQSKFQPFSEVGGDFLDSFCFRTERQGCIWEI